MREKVSAMAGVFAKLPGFDSKRAGEKYLEQIRRSMRAVTVPGVATADELIAAADKGPEELAALVVSRTPAAVGSIASMTTMQGTPAFLKALIENGVSVNHAATYGRTLLMDACNGR